MIALPDTSVTDSIIMSGIMLCVILISGVVITMTVFRETWWDKWKGRKYRREAISHPDRFCWFCHGTSTRLVKSYTRGRWHCKDRELCRQTTEMRRLLDSLP
jgi:hypothetical protein